MGRRLVVLCLVPLIACFPTSSDPCGSGEVLCDSTCVPENNVCCENGTGAICPLGYVCGTTAQNACLRAPAVTIEVSPDPSCANACGGGGCAPICSPQQAVITRGESVAWRNNTDAAIVMTTWDIDGPYTPLTSANPGEVSNPVEYDTAGNFHVSVQSCIAPSPDNRPYSCGVVTVTAN